MKKFSCGLGCLLALASASAGSHSFGVIYNLPVPFWMYAYAAGAALVASFVVLAYLVTPKSPGTGFCYSLPDAVQAWYAGLTSLLVLRIRRTLSVLLLAVTLLTGLLGTRDSYTNFNMTFFWTVFVLGFAYLAAIVGDFYSALNPWKVVCEWLNRWIPGLFRERWRYPPGLAYYPAFAIYVAFIWFELFGHPDPRTLSYALLAYTGVNLGGAACFGIFAWFRYGDFFGVYFRVIALISPFERRGDRLLMRAPFFRLSEGVPDHFSLLLFILFMLSSTAFDGIHETLPWTDFFWGNIYPLLEPLGSGRSQPYLFLVDFFYYWQWLSLLVSAFFYLGLYSIFIWLAKLLTGSRLTVRELSLRFTYSLVPIAFVYNLAHYYTLAVAQGSTILRLISDPFAFGWNLFGTGDWFTQPVVLDAGTVWHTQVAVILVGHIVSVYLAHVEAIRIFPTARKAVISQLPMLALMVLFTTIGLWILSLPIASGQVVQPPPSG